MILDIETHGQAASLAMPYPSDRSAPANYKDPEKIAAWHIRDEAEWRAGLAKQCALSPRLGRIVAAGVHYSDLEDSPPIVACDVNEANETKIVEFAMRHLMEHRTVATFNGHLFDLPYLFVRAAILGVPVPVRAAAYLRRYTTDPHVDCRMILSNWNTSAEGKLDDWCAAFGIECDDPTTGADVGDMVDRGDEQGIIAHCQKDLVKTGKLTQKIEAAGLI